MEEIKVIVAGGRDFSDYALMGEMLDEVFASQVFRYKEIIILSGKARGADTLGEQFARERGLRVMELPADWKKNWRRAGFRRNEEMLLEADALVAFWDGRSHGTEHMIEIS